MGFLKLDYDNVNTGFDPLPVGDYECIVSEVEVKQAASGNMMIKTTLTVRDDVDQAGAKRKFFDNLVEVENMMWKFNQVGKAADVPKDIEDLQDFANAILYKSVMIRNKHRMYEGEKQDSVGAWKVSQAASADFTGQMGATGGQTVDVSDDDLPF